ncbi:golgin subfamily A member 2 isoform X2 [Octopus sinensis]|uniref:Golgin subfamily A member 2 isoform X2 n=1 Tax=Octopus sinensis TaxID=2607531 RepID=A0A6P7TXI4_9MOLL|nr:golgin subfamily A member 2 isoform X2 [Octopus sinensis]
MADVVSSTLSKKDKLAAARKKLKRFKEKNKTPGQDTKSSSMRSSVSPSFNPSIVGEKTSSVTDQNPHLPDLHINERPTASTESLHQLSQHINDLLHESNAIINGEAPVENSSVAQLEERNRELAALLEKHIQANEQLNVQVQQLRDQSQQLQNELHEEKQSFVDKQRDVGSLKDQLQVHIQTIGILVAEKTELQSKIDQLKKQSDQRLDEIEEMGGRLRVSRQRITELERNMSSINSSSQQYEKNSKGYAKDIDKLKLELYKSNQTVEELQQQLSELNGKLSSKVSDCLAHEQNVEDLRKKLEMAELYTQQLSSQSDKESLKLIDSLQQEREEYIKKVEHYQEAFQTVTNERNQQSEQYQHYIDQLQQQTQSLTNQVTSLTDEREKLYSEQHEAESKMHSLRRQLEEAESQSQCVSISSSDLQSEINKLRADYEELAKRHETQIRDNAQLSRFLEEKENKIMDLESTVGDLKEESSNKAQLLENIQSDKTALSRALTQNKDLKQQLAELQNGFVKMSNDSMELMTKLQSEEHRAHELADRLAQQEDELKDMRELLASRDLKLDEIQKCADHLQRENYQQEQIQDRLRHYEAQAQLVETLQRELSASQDMMNALTTQNSELRNMLVKSRDNKDIYDESKDEKNDTIIGSLQATICQLEAERNQLIENLNDQRNLSDNLSVKVADVEEQLKMTTNPDENIVSRVEFDKLKKTMEAIQEKYTRAMRDKADLSDKADQLEHLVLQLQGETDTIGEYISLYHHQRALLQQREFQKNDYISRLSKDREELQGKLAKLQGLVVQMLHNKGNLSNARISDTLLSKDYQNSEDSNVNHSNDIQPHLHGATVMNGLSKYPEDWPDYSSTNSSESVVEAIVAGESMEHIADLPEDQAFKSQLEKNADLSPVPLRNTSKSEQLIQKCNMEEDNPTARKILDLFSEIDSNLCDAVPYGGRKFLPCKYCKGTVKDV